MDVHFDERPGGMGVNGSVELAAYSLICECRKAGEKTYKN